MTLSMPAHSPALRASACSTFRRSPGMCTLVDVVASSRSSFRRTRSARWSSAPSDSKSRRVFSVSKRQSSAGVGAVDVAEVEKLRRPRPSSRRARGGIARPARGTRAARVASESSFSGSSIREKAADPKLPRGCEPELLDRDRTARGIVHRLRREVLGEETHHSSQREGVSRGARGSGRPPRRARRPRGGSTRGSR